MYSEVSKSLIHHLNDALKVYIDHGVVTAKDIELMTSIDFLDKLSIFMPVIGYPNAIVQKNNLLNGDGFVGIMYDPKYYTMKSGDNYFTKLPQNRLLWFECIYRISKLLKPYS